MTLPYPPPYQDIATLAEHLCLSERAIEEWVKDGRLPAPKTNHRGIRLWKWAEIKERREREASKQGTIYFVGCEQFIKIGFTHSLNVRLKGLSGVIPFPITLLHSISGTVEDEAALHRRFVHLKHHREWFRAEPDLIAFVAGLK